MQRSRSPERNKKPDIPEKNEALSHPPMKKPKRQTLLITLRRVWEEMEIILDKVEKKTWDLRFFKDATPLLSTRMHSILKRLAPAVVRTDLIAESVLKHSKAMAVRGHSSQIILKIYFLNVSKYIEPLVVIQG